MIRLAFAAAPCAPLRSPASGAAADTVPSADSRRTGASLGMAVAVAVGAAAVVWRHLPRCYFFQDDFLHLQALANDRLLHFVLQPWSGHVYLLRNSIFALFYFVLHTRTTLWFACVLATHLVNVALLAMLVGRLTDSPRLACVGGVAWGTAPMHDGTLGWYSVYGQVVAATLLLVVLLGVVRVERGDTPLRGRTLAGWCALLLAGATAFGVGAGIAVAFPLVVFLCLPASTRLRLAALALPVLVVLVYWGDHVLVARWFGDRSEAELDMLLALSAYWQNTVEMVPHLVAAGVTGTALGWIHPLATYPDAVGYAAGALFAAGIAAGVVAGPPRMRRLLLALAALAVGGYATIAAGRATFWGALGVRAFGAGQARYHYAATLPMVAAACLLLARVGAGVPSRAKSALLIVWLIATATFAARSPWHLDVHDADRVQTTRVVGAVADALARAPAGMPAVIPNQPFPAAIFSKAFAGTAAVYTIFFPAADDGRIRFVEPDPAVRALGPPGSRLAAVLVPPGP